MTLPHPLNSTFIMALGLVLLVAGCDQPRAHGDANAVIVAADDELWRSVEEEFRAQMEPPIQTVRTERPFRITPVDPELEDAWGQLRRFRQLVLMGTPDTPWMTDALAQVDGSLPDAPALISVRNVWARGQTVWLLLLPEADPGPAVSELAGEIMEVMDAEYRDYVRSRQFVSGRDSILADSLAQNVGFSMQFPQVYRYSVQDSVFRFRNDNPSPRELIREVAVTWVEPAPEEDPTQEELEEWRLQLTRDHYVDPQDLDLNVVTYGPMEINGVHGVEFQSAWQSTPEGWPAGGPFIVRALRCPDQDRMYLMDAWVYAPEREKYEYVLQLQNILNSFRCH
jgi:hypothetical protein